VNKTITKQIINRIIDKPTAPKYADKVIVCAGCQTEFSWKAGEQAYFHSKGMNAPRWCAACKAKRREFFVGHPEIDNRKSWSDHHER
jgi:hypothetical protein